MSCVMWIPSIFSDGAVLQRDVVNRIFGKDEGAREVTARLDGAEYFAPVINGAFELSLPSHAAAKGLTLEIRGSERVELHDICFGDVFLLSGQSNMALTVAQTLGVTENEVKGVKMPYIRHFSVTPNYAFSGAGALLPSRWTRAEDEAVMEMSAAGFFFARELYESVDVPIGLILNAVGGATVEAWMSKETLERFGDYKRYYGDFLPDGAIYRFMSDCERGKAKWYESVRASEAEGFSFAVPKNAKSFFVPNMTMKTELHGFSGSVWFYKEFFADEVTNEAYLHLGELVDSDETYINGVKVGETTYRYPRREYHVDTGILKKGKNLLASRLVIERGAGGFIPEHEYFIEIDGKRQPLSGEWRYFVEKQAEKSIGRFILESNTVVKKDSVWFDLNRKEGFIAPQVPTGLYNGALLPLRGIGIKSVLWYQGESNADAPDRYVEKLSAMITEWRAALRQRLPLICVELADYTEPTSENPDNSGWASVQEQQRRAARVIKDCAVVSSKDLGESFELHPRNKLTLGRRLAERVKEFVYNI